MYLCIHIHVFCLTSNLEGKPRHRHREGSKRQGKRKGMPLTDRRKGVFLFETPWWYNAKADHRAPEAMGAILLDCILL